MTKPLMTLTASFDVNQVDDGIDWLFADVEANASAERTASDQHWNRDINFSAGQQFRIAVTATDDDKTNFESFDIVDCCLITRPRILRCGPGVRTNYAPPSLFLDETGKELGALCRIDPSAFIALDIDNESQAKKRRVTMLWDGHLTVGKYNGFWEIAFYVTVNIKRAHEEARQLRVFYFDPEGEVGNGTDPPDPH